VITGKDRQFNEYTITVHGPGVAIVSDVTPNDGVLADDIDTIQLVGTDPNRTYVTGQVTSSARIITDGTVRFNHLIAETGVASIILNGFTLSRTLSPQATGFFDGRPRRPTAIWRSSCAGASGTCRSTTSRRRSTWRPASSRSTSSSATRRRRCGSSRRSGWTASSTPVLDPTQANIPPGCR
jgi:hypothetical protein